MYKEKLPPAAREKLLKAATKEFYKNGFEKATLRKICSEAGVATGALYFFSRTRTTFFARRCGHSTRKATRRRTSEMF